MQSIRILDTKTINKIAAGEVVEGPKSVVKELVENAIDAGATAVTVEIKEGGISYIRIMDNGCGIPKEQVKTAFLRHATSKMSEIEDLEHIFTLGFRGEALASIAGVAQVEMLTKTRDEETGTSIEISGGEIKNIQDTSCTEGTTITVKNLFYNVPARRKFLKKPATESGFVSDLMNKLALGHPEVSFRFINNDTTMLHTAGNGDLKASVFYVYGKEAANSMVPLEYKKGEYALSGLIGKPELSRGNRNYENLFINGRFIKNKVVATAVEDAYKTRLLIGKFPIFVLNFQMNPSQVDVNVHPAKLEVRFKNDDEIYEFFHDAVSKTLDQLVLIPQVGWDKAPAVKTAEKHIEIEQQKIEDIPVYKSLPSSFTQDRAASGGMGKSVDQLLNRQQGTQNQVRQSAEAFLIDPVIVRENVEITKTQQKPLVNQISNPQILNNQVGERVVEPKVEPFFKQYKMIGQIFQTYWMIEQGECLYLIDQHAAHERILFEEFMNRFKEENMVSQKLLLPQILNLTPSEIEVLRENQSLLEGFGFEFETFGQNQYALKAVPYLLKEPSGAGFFTEILDSLSEQKIRSVYDMKLLAVATMACKAAVKGHDRLSFQEAEAMIGRLLKLENPFTCPHGRPTIIEMTKYELEKKFKRIQN
ncbi:MAG: DNA mismatch repair endonuclease MutL [Anaerotignum propionicum]|uniref:DNA mismatch repair endonuclease MutL n=1 Tax=Anaerotignum propionicum TaxID=28446 RepID=UPI002B208A70|nr:DNA mismatch repair endonuclease MutL [Anaerotignum propionicum]MEA5056022.1 DNA mismatch repair endonuclease MutL [Anaerotignum propionicum]